MTEFIILFIKAITLLSLIVLALMIFAGFIAYKKDQDDYIDRGNGPW